MMDHHHHGPQVSNGVGEEASLHLLLDDKRLTQKSEDWYHVAILGAGAAGLLCALALATIDPNLDIVVVDHSRVKYPGSPSDDDEEQPSGINQQPSIKSLPSDHIWLNSHSLEILSALGLLEDVTQIARPLHSVCVLAPDGTSQEVKRFAKSNSTKFVSGIVVEQWKLERLLCSHLEALNIEIWRFHAVVEIDINSRDEHRASAADFPIVLKCREYKATSLTFQWVAEERRIMTKFVVGADGYHSIVKRTLGISSIPSMTPSYEYMLADYLMVAECAVDGTAFPIDPDEWMNQIRIIHRNAGSGIIWPFSEPFKFRLIMRRKRNMTKRSSSDADTDDDPTAEGLGGKRDDAIDEESSPGDDQLCAEMSSHSMSPPFAKRDTTPQSPCVTKSSYKRLNPANDDQLKHIARVIFGPGWLVKDVIWKRAYSVNYETADTLVRLGRSLNSVNDTTYGAILIGNAARAAPPLWSAGLNLSVEDVYQLGWRLVGVIRNRLPSTVLTEDFSTLRLERTKFVFEVCAHELDNLLNADKCFSVDKWKARVLAAPMQKLLNIQNPQELIKDLNSIHTLGYDDADVPGLSSIRVVNLNPSEEGGAKVVELSTCLRFKPLRNHVFLMVIRLLPHGTKIKTIFGCERSELAERFNPAEVESLISLTHAISGRLREITFAWVFTPVIRYKIPDITMSDPNKYIQKVPMDLLTRVPKYHLTYFDHDGEAYNGLNVKFEDSTTPLLTKQTCREEVMPSAGAAYCFLNPEGRRIVQGFVGEKDGLVKIDEYLRTFSIMSDNLEQ